MSETTPLPTSSTELYDSFRGKPIDQDKFVVITGRGNLPLAQAVGKLLSKEITQPCSDFESDEIRVRVTPNLRRRGVFILQSMFPNPNDRLQETVFMADAARRANAEKGKITGIFPYFAYSREDRKSQPRMPISVAVVARQLVSAGLNTIFTMDIHSGQAQGTVEEAWDDVSSDKVIVPRVRQLGIEGAVVLSPDAGSAKRAEKFLTHLQNGNDHDLAIAYKKRDPQHPERSETNAILGDVKDRPVIIYDDLIATGGTIFNAAELAKQNGAQQVVAAATHGLFARGSDGKTLPDRLLEPNCPIDKVIVTDTIQPSRDVLENPRVEVVSVAPVIAVAILCYLTGESISERLIA